MPVEAASAGQDLLASLAAEWQAGQVTDLWARLSLIDRAIDARPRRQGRSAAGVSAA